MSRKEKQRLKAYLSTLSTEDRMLLKYRLQEKSANNIIFDEVQYGNVFRECMGKRVRKRVRNTYSKEEMGTCPNVVYRVRTSPTSVCVCRGWANR